MSQGLNRKIVARAVLAVFIEKRKQAFRRNYGAAS